MRSNQYRIPFFLLFFSLMALAACRPVDVYEKHTNFKGHGWPSSKPAEGSFNITDTANAYSLYVVLRHTDAYKYNNIWLDVSLQSPGDTMFTQKLNLVLGSDAQGWEGTGMNDIWEVRKIMNGQPRVFKKAGIYKYSLRQVMRDDPLEHIMSAGLRIEKAVK